MHEKEPWNKFDFIGEPDPDMSPEQRATIEAMKRVDDLGDSNNLISFTVDKSSIEIANYLEAHKSELIPEEQFYLQATIAYRKKQSK